MSDLDNDGILNDNELNFFQVMFTAPFSADMTWVFKIVEVVIPLEAIEAYG